MKTHSVWSPIVDMLISHAQNELSQSDLAAFLNNQGISPETASAPAIFIAIRYERWEIVRRLLSSKRALPMDLTVSSNKYCNNKSPLMVAMETSYTPIDVVELILKKGSSNLNHKDLQKNTPLFSACSSSKSNNKLLQMLLMYDKDMYESSINPNIHNLTGATPLYTCAFHSLESAKTLVSHFKSLHHHLDLSLVDEEGKSLLHHAVEKNRLDVVEFVLQFAKESGQLARILAQQIPDSGNTALHLSSKNAAMLSLILAYDLKVSVNIGNSLGMTALMLQVEKIGETGVVSNDHVPEVIKILVEKGDADLSIRNKNGKSASDIAYGGGLEGLNEYLSKVLK